MKAIMIAAIVLLILLGLIYEKSRYLSIALMGVFFILVCFSQDSYDYNVYTEMYYSALSAKILTGERLLNFLMGLGQHAGINYNQFRAIATLIEIILINSTVKKFCSKSSIFWAIFILFPGWWITTLLRHGLALSIMIFSLRYLLEDKKGNTLKLLACIVVAGFMHSAFWFYLVLLLTKFLKPKMILLGSLVGVGIVYFSSRLNVIQLVARYLPVKNSVFQYAFSYSHSLVGDLFDIFIQLLIIGFGILAIFAVMGKNWKNTINVIMGHCEDATEFFLYKVSLVNLTSILVLAMITYTSTSARLNHFYFVLNILCWAFYFSNIIKNKWSITIWNIVVTGVPVLLSYVYMTVVSTSLYETVFLMIFETNSFINIFR